MSCEADPGDSEDVVLGRALRSLVSRHPFLEVPAGYISSKFEAVDVKAVVAARLDTCRDLSLSDIMLLEADARAAARACGLNVSRYSGDFSAKYTEAYERVYVFYSNFTQPMRAP